MIEDPLDGFGSISVTKNKKTEEYLKQYFNFSVKTGNHNKILILLILAILAGCFFYSEGGEIFSPRADAFNEIV